MHIETLAVHAAPAPDPTTGAVTPPIHLSTTFERERDGTFRQGYIYIRDRNPTRGALESALALLEGGETAFAFASGQAATSAVFQALASGDHVIASDYAYYGTPKLLREVYARWGLEASFVDMRDVENVRRALRPNTRLVWVETPSNPLLTVTDIAAVCAVAREAGARCVVDNTWASPVAQRPLALGADAVMHSTTKYLGGHSDVQGGAIVVRTEDDFSERLRLLQKEGGAVAAPFDAWLVLRGIRTLPWRVRAHSENAMAVARALAGHPHLEAVHYPGLPTHPGHAIAAAQMSLFGGMMSIQVQGGRADAFAVAARVKLFTRATSLGGVESLIEHRASVEGPNTRSPENLLRISVGLEHHEDLIEDLMQALG
jgi:cystathionine gamma-synthase